MNTGGRSPVAAEARNSPVRALPPARLILLSVLGVLLLAALTLVGVATWCVTMNGVLMRDLLKGRWRPPPKEEGWRQCTVEGQMDEARFERFFGDLSDYTPTYERHPDR